MHDDWTCIPVLRPLVFKQFYNLPCFIVNACNLNAILTHQGGNYFLFYHQDMHSQAYGAVEFVDLHSTK